MGVTDATPPTDEDYQDPGVETPHHPEEAGDANVYEELERYYPSSSPVRATPPPPPPSRAEETRNLVKKFIADIWNRGAVDMIPTICSPALRFNGTTGALKRASMILLRFCCLLYSFISLQDSIALATRA